MTFLKCPIVFLLIFVHTTINAQYNTYYIYLQSNDLKPFYIKHNKKIYSSSANGYLIVPKLSNGTYIFSLGFPRQEGNEVFFNIDINNQDQGFIINNSSEPIILSSVIDKYKIAQFDPNLAKNKLNDSLNNADTKVNTVLKVPPAIKNEEILKNSNISPVLLRKVLKNDITYISYVDVSLNTNDTISIIIEPTNQKISEPTIAIKILEDNISIDSSRIEAANGSLTPDPIDSASMNQPKLVLYNTDCKKVATKDDYINLRKKLAGLEDQEEMLKLSTKAFKQKCYTSDQLLKIGVIYNTDEYKLAFFKLAYYYTYDSENFKIVLSVLETESSKQELNKWIKK